MVLITLVWLGIFIDCIKSQNTLDSQPSVLNGYPVTSSLEAPFYARLEICSYKEACLSDTCDDVGLECSHCGGTWISGTDIITAAHCFPQGPKPADLVRYFVNEDNTYYMNATGQTSDFVIHENFNGAYQGNDIAIVRTSQTPGWSKPAELARTNTALPIGKLVTTYGFGDINTDSNLDAPEILQRSRPMVTVGCFSGSDTVVCYNRPNDDPLDMGGPCQGDSGGPVVYGGKLHGLNSYNWAILCGSASTVATRIADFYDWIVEHSNYTADADFWPTISPVECDALACSHSCYLTNDGARCGCPLGLAIDPENQNTCVEAAKALKFSQNMVAREDLTLRPFADESMCLYHKMNGYTENELIYVGACRSHPRYRWEYDEVSGLVMNHNLAFRSTSKFEKNPHCLQMPEYEITKKKRALVLAPCDPVNPSQQFDMDNGMIKHKHNHDLCIMWNMFEGSRLWGYPCGEYLFSEMIITGSSGTEMQDAPAVELDIDSDNCSAGSMAINSIVFCICPLGQTIDPDSHTQCIDIVESSQFRNTVVRPYDYSIRPFYDQSKCWYHKMNGYTENELIYIGDCYDHNRYRWFYDDHTGVIMNHNRRSTTPHCVAVPDPTITLKKQQIFLAPCNTGSASQKFDMIDGMVKVRVNPDICVMWNLLDKTRLWALPCAEHVFSDLA